MLIEWPTEFTHDDSFVWRDHAPSFQRRMELITWFAHLNFTLINKD